MRIKSCDLLYAMESVTRWCKVGDKVDFVISGCVLLLLIIKAGSGCYPVYNPDEVTKLQMGAIQSGWAEAYSGLGVKYSTSLKRSVPTAAATSRGSTIDNKKLVMEESVEDTVERLRKRKRDSET